MRIFAYLRPYLFRIVHVFWTARGCVDGLVSMVQNVKDFEMLERLRLGNDNEDNIPPSDCVDYVGNDNIDSDDETYDPANPNHEDYF